MLTVEENENEEQITQKNVERLEQVTESWASKGTSW